MTCETTLAKYRLSCGERKWSLLLTVRSRLLVVVVLLLPCAWHHTGCDVLADVAEADDIAKLHTDVTTCETVLMNMESMLQHFQDTLGGISREIRHLQDKSMEMNVQLKNRKAVQSKLQLFLDKVAVSRPFIESICEVWCRMHGPLLAWLTFMRVHTPQDEINDAYVALLRQLSAKIRYAALAASTSIRPHTLTLAWLLCVRCSYTAQRSTQAGRAGAGGGSNPAADFGIDPSDTKAGHDVIPELERLRVKAVTRVRAFLLEKIADLRKPRTNVQMVQEHVLLRHKFVRVLRCCACGCLCLWLPVAACVLTVPCH